MRKVMGLAWILVAASSNLVTAEPEYRYKAEPQGGYAAGEEGGPIYQPTAYTSPYEAPKYCPHYGTLAVPESELNAGSNYEDAHYRLLLATDAACKGNEYWKAWLVYVHFVLIFLNGTIVIGCCCCCVAGDIKGPQNFGTDAEMGSGSELQTLENSNGFYGGIVSEKQQMDSVSSDLQSGIHDKRTNVGNTVATREFLANFFSWYGMFSRYCIFGGGVLMLLCMMLILSFMTGNEDNPSEAASVSSYVQDESTAQGKVFKAFLITGCTLVLMSNFGFFVLPKWIPDSMRNHQSNCSSGCLGICNCAPLCGCLGICSPHRTFSPAANQYTWVLQEEGRTKIWFQIVASIFLLLVGSIPIHTNRSFNRATSKGANFETRTADLMSDNIHTVSAVLGCLMIIFMEYAQLIRGEQVLAFPGFVSNLQKLRFGSVTLSFVFLLGYVVFGYVIGAPPLLPDGTIVYSKDQTFGFLCEVLAIAFLGWDLILISFIPPSANMSALAFAGSSEPTFDPTSLTPAQRALPMQPQSSSML